MSIANPEKRPVDSDDRYKALLAVSKTIVAHRRLADLFRDLAGQLDRVVDFDNLALALHEAASNTMRVDVLEGYTILDRSRIVIPLEGTPEGDVWQKQQRVVLSDVSELRSLPALAEVLEPVGINSVCLLFLRTSRQPLGVLAFASYRPCAYASADFEFLQAVADQVAVAVENARAFGDIEEEKNRLSEENAYLVDDIRAEHNFGDIIYQSAGMRKVLDEVEMFAPTDMTVLIRGEPGTGKELVAREVHKRSLRKDARFTAVNCAAIQADLEGSELFGHEKGAFTGADRQRIGRFELTNQGTLFLDEVGDCSLQLQAKLLRVLQESEFERVGGNKSVKVDVRVVAATNCDLEQMMAEGRFRRDLFGRLNQVQLLLPPLRKRTEDIPLLVRDFTSDYARKHHKRIEKIPSAIMEAFVQYDWPDNIRGLQYVIERAVIRSPGLALQVRPDEFGAVGQRSEVRGQSSEFGGQKPQREHPAVISDTRHPPTGRTLADTERERILTALNETHWNQTAAARSLSVARTTLQNKMKRLKITSPK